MLLKKVTNVIRSGNYRLDFVKHMKDVAKTHPSPYSEWNKYTSMIQN